jgi:hypothetical protein
MTNDPRMIRSRNQLSTAYAPQAFFTFEGGLGACIAESDREPDYQMSTASVTTQNQILQRIEELARSWFERALRCRGTDGPPISPELTVDHELLNETRDGVKRLNLHRVAFLDPLQMGYRPAPLAFRCRHCHLFRSYETVPRLHRDLPHLSPATCMHPKRPGRCEWQQLDVVFVHWSGEWHAPTPGRYEWDSARGRVHLVGERCGCGSTDFELNADSAAIGRWYFRCARCSEPKGEQWILSDEFTVSVLRDAYAGRFDEARMEPVSYRASASYYPLTEQFIQFDRDNEEALAILDPQRQPELERFIGQVYRFEGALPPIEEIERLLIAAGKAPEWARYQTLGDAIATLGASPKNDALVSRLRAEQQGILESWFSGPIPILRRPAELPEPLVARIQQRAEAPPKFDPFRLALEHEVLRRAKLERRQDEYGRRPFVPFDDLRTDLDVHPTGRPDDTPELEQQVRGFKERLGFEVIGLIREFNLCRFTFAFSRVSPMPVVFKHDKKMPVRLRLFPEVSARDGNRHPVYVVQQANEAIYVRLKEETVYAWLNALNPSDRFDWRPGDRPSIGGRLLERSLPFGRYLDNLSEGSASAYLYVYTLLHTLSHAMMRSIAESSGLDLGSLGEYLFPTDLSFAIYRNGTTMDLGNLSALWRNDNVHFLESLLASKLWSCNSGALCSEKGGACPDCIFVPETSCIAQNQLLCRSTVAGGQKAIEDHSNRLIAGYFGIAHRR